MGVACPYRLLSAFTPFRRLSSTLLQALLAKGSYQIMQILCACIWYSLIKVIQVICITQSCYVCFIITTFDCLPGIYTTYMLYSAQYTHADRPGVATAKQLLVEVSIVPNEISWCKIVTQLHSRTHERAPPPLENCTCMVTCTQYLC